MLDPQILICSAAGAIQYLLWYVNIFFEIWKKLVPLRSCYIIVFSSRDYTCITIRLKGKSQEFFPL